MYYGGGVFYIRAVVNLGHENGLLVNTVRAILAEIFFAVVSYLHQNGFQ